MFMHDQFHYFSNSIPNLHKFRLSINYHILLVSHWLKKGFETIDLVSNKPRHNSFIIKQIHKNILNCSRASSRNQLKSLYFRCNATLLAKPTETLDHPRISHHKFSYSAILTKTLPQNEDYNVTRICNGSKININSDPAVLHQLTCEHNFFSHQNAISARKGSLACISVILSLQNQYLKNISEEKQNNRHIFNNIMHTPKNSLQNFPHFLSLQTARLRPNFKNQVSKKLTAFTNYQKKANPVNVSLQYQSNKKLHPPTKNTVKKNSKYRNYIICSSTLFLFYNHPKF